MNKPQIHSDAKTWEPSPNNLESFWMGFTPNRAFKQRPRMIARAKDMHYYDMGGRPILDGSAGLWCTNAGHCRDPIVTAIQKSASELDFAPTFQYGHPKAFELAARLAAMAPGDLNYAFFCNSGSEAADTALKIALAFQRVKGQASRTRLIGRERGYHGVNFGGISVGGMVGNRKMFGTMIAGVDHLPHTYNRKEQAFTKGEPEYGMHYADELERLVALHDASTIAAVIVEPMAGSTGVLPPPKGYLKRLREICDKHGILLIFDEVITAFGRLGAGFGAQRFGVTPDIITVAKGLTNGVIPMGAVLVKESVYQALMSGPENLIELFHGYTYSGHPVAAAAGLATMQIYQDEGTFAQVRGIEGTFETLLHELRAEPHVIDIRNIGLMGGVELSPRAGSPGARGYEVFLRCFDEGVVIRNSGDIIQLSPFFASTDDELIRIIDTIRRALRAVA